MERTEIFTKLNEIFKDVLDLDDSSNLTDSTTANDIEEWDSLSVVSFIAMAKAACGKKVERTVVANAKTIGELFALLK